MSSHLSVSFTPNAPGANAVTGFATEPEAAVEGADVLGGFAAILSGLLSGDLTKALPQPGEATLDAAIGDLLQADTAATPVAAPPTQEPPAELPSEAPALLADLVDLLTALDTALDAGESPDPALLEKLDKTLDALAGLLGLPTQPEQTTPTLAPALDAAIKTTAPAVPVADPAAKPGILEQFLGKTQEIAEKLVDSGGGLPAKLASVAQMIAAPALAPALLAKLGLEAGATLADAGLDLALDALVAPKPEAKPAAAPQPFAAPELKLPLGTAAAKPAAAPAAPAAEPAQAAADVRIEPATRPKPAAPEAQVKPSVPAQAAPTPALDAGAAPQTAALPQQTAPTLHTAAEAKPLPAAYHTPQVNLPQVAFEMARQVQAGASRFQIRLDPPELGRVDVRMDVDAGGNVNARLTVERTETLDLMQRDQRALERALAQAGLDTAKTNLEFSLKQNPFERPQGHGAPEKFQFDGGGTPLLEAAETPSITLYRGSASAGGVNIFV